MPTSQLGLAASQLGNGMILGGGLPTPPPSMQVPQVYAPPVSGGPIHAPWNRFPRQSLLTQTSASKPPAIVPQIYAPPIAGGPIVGVPWNRMPRIVPLMSFPQPPAPIPISPQVYAPPVSGGPIGGTPWNRRPGNTLPALPVTHGNSPTPPVPPITPPLRGGTAKPFINKVPDAPTRLRRHADEVATLLNSLLGQGFIYQTDPNTFALSSGQFQEARAPTVHDDSSVGVTVGSVWVNTATNQAYINIVNTIGSAIWKQVTA